MYGEGAVTDRMCQKWSVNFCARDFLLDHASWLGRPVDINSNQIKTLIENKQCYTTWEIADKLKISINKVIGQNEQCVFYFTDKTKWTLANPVHTYCGYCQALLNSLTLTLYQ